MLKIPANVPNNVNVLNATKSTRCSVFTPVRPFCGPIDCSTPASSVHGIFQPRILEGVAISFPRGIFPSQEWNPCFLRLLHRQADSLPPQPGKPQMPQNSRRNIFTSQEHKEKKTEIKLARVLNFKLK